MNNVSNYGPKCVNNCSFGAKLIACEDFWDSIFNPSLTKSTRACVNSAFQKIANTDSADRFVLSSKIDRPSNSASNTIYEATSGLINNKSLYSERNSSWLNFFLNFANKIDK